MKWFRSIAVMAAILISMEIPAHAGVILAGGVFTGRIDRWDPSQGAAGITTFSDIAAQTSTSGMQIFISGMAYNPVTNRLLVSGNASNSIYELNAQTGQVLRTIDGNAFGLAGASGIAVGQDGTVYVSNLNSGSVTVFDANLTVASQIAIGPVGLSGIAVNPQGNLVISTFGGGVLQYDLGTQSITTLTTNPAAQGSAAIAADGTTYVGSITDLQGNLPASLVNNVYRMDASGQPTGVLTIDDNLLPPPAGFESFPTAPGAVALNAEGQVIVGVLGRTSPFNGGVGIDNGGLFVFDPTVFGGGTATPLFSATNTTPYSTVLYFSAIPEPSSALAMGVGIAALGVIRRFRKRSAGPSATS